MFLASYRNTSGSLGERDSFFEFCTAPEMITTKWSLTLKWYQIDPEVIPNPKWSIAQNAATHPGLLCDVRAKISSCRPRNDPHEIKEWWLNMGLWIPFLLFVEMLQLCHFFFYSYEVSNKRKLVVRSVSCSSLASVSFQSTELPEKLY